MMKKDDFYITFLNYARDQLLVGDGTVKYSAVLEHVRSVHSEVNERAFKRTFLQAVESIVHLGRTLRVDDDLDVHQLVLTLEAYFHLLEHQELQEARQASQVANRNAKNAVNVAVGAIVVSIVVAITSIAFNVFQMFSSDVVTVDEAQVANIQEFIRSENDRLTR